MVELCSTGDCLGEEPKEVNKVARVAGGRQPPASDVLPPSCSCDRIKARKHSSAEKTGMFLMYFSNLQH